MKTPGWARKPFSEGRCEGAGKPGVEVGEFYLRCPSCGRRLENRRGGKVPPHTNPLRGAGVTD